MFSRFWLTLVVFSFSLIIGSSYLNKYGGVLGQPICNGNFTGVHWELRGLPLLTLNTTNYTYYFNPCTNWDTPCADGRNSVICEIDLNTNGNFSPAVFSGSGFTLTLFPGGAIQPFRGIVCPTNSPQMASASVTYLCQSDNTTELESVTIINAATCSYAATVLVPYYLCLPISPTPTPTPRPTTAPPDTSTSSTSTSTSSTSDGGTPPTAAILNSRWIAITFFVIVLVIL